MLLFDTNNVITYNILNPLEIIIILITKIKNRSINKFNLLLCTKYGSIPNRKRMFIIVKRKYNSCAHTNSNDNDEEEKDDKKYKKQTETFIASITKGN